MSKLSFRARALDASKPLPIYHAEEIPESADCSLINRAVPQMPTGMEKEEEAEHHLQQAIVAGTVIPTPEVYVVENVEYYDRIYPEDFKMPRQLIYMQPFSMETDIPDYDMDAEDEMWITAQTGKLELTPEKFEEMMDRLEKGSGQTVVTLQEAKALIKEDDDLIIAVYDYWLNKRLKTQHPLIPHVRTEARHGVANHNPYIAFRRRTEKMQTRKNRKNDESSYEKMLKLKRDLQRAVNLLEMVKKREKSKRELLHLTIEVFEKRTQAGDFSGQIVSEALQQRPARPAFTPLFQPNSLSWIKEEAILASLSRKERRQYKKRRHKSSSKNHNAATGSAAAFSFANAQGLSLDGEGASSDDDLIQPASPSEGEDEDDGVYAFRRRKDCEYHAPVDNSDWPWCAKEEIDKRYKFYPTSIPTRGGGYRALGPCRRRVGRGGRVILDRMSIHDLRQLCRSMGYDPSQSFATSPTRSSKTPSPTHTPTTTDIPVPHPETNNESEQIETTTTVPVSPPSPDYSYAPLGCWHHFQPKTPEDFTDMTMISDQPEPESASEGRSIEDSAIEDDVNMSLFTDKLTSSYHVGLVVSSGDRPMSYPVTSLISDPPLHQEPFGGSSIETPGELVILDEQTSELENTYYLMELNNEFLNDDVEADTLFSSMDVDAGVEESTTAVDGDNNDASSSTLSSSTSTFPPPQNPPSGSSGPPPPPPPTSETGDGSSPPTTSSSTPTQPDSSPETTNATIVNVKSGEEADTAAAGGKSDTDTSQSSREYKSYAFLISV